jgi:hypothetical protein
MGKCVEINALYDDGRYDYRNTASDSAYDISLSSRPGGASSRSPCCAGQHSLLFARTMFKSAATKLAHNSTISAIAGNKALRPLQDLITAEKTIITL